MDREFNDKTMRVALGIEYNGSRFSGWQRQENADSIQAAVEEALSRVADHPVKVVCAGRTDTGVHALQQVVHFDTTAVRSERSWCFGANTHLPKDIAVTWASPVDEAFHARFSAVKRTYRYVILNRSVRPTFLAYRVSWEYRPLNIEYMAHAAQFLVGKHNFNAYRAVGCQAKSPVRHVYRLTVRRQGEMVLIDIEANAFLHHMVRNIAGVLMAIGAGERPANWSHTVLTGEDRRLGGITAPAHGLYLVDVEYPDKFKVPRLLDTQMIW